MMAQLPSESLAAYLGRTMLVIVVTGSIRSEGVTHSQVRFAKEHDENVVIWARMVPTLSLKWEFSSGFPVEPSYPMGVACAIVDNPNRLTVAYGGGGFAAHYSAEIDGFVVPHFMATIDSPDAEHVIERIEAAWNEYREQQQARSKREAEVKALRDECETRIAELDAAHQQTIDGVVADYEAKVKALRDG